MAKSKAIAKKGNGGVPATLEEEMAADAGDGTQGMTTKDMAIPFLRVLQKMSPQLAKREGAYIEGAQEGDIINTVTGQLWSEEDSLVVIPCAFMFKFIEWTAREDGGGYVDSFTREDALPETQPDERKRARRVDNNHIISDTAEHYVIIVSPDGGFEHAVISMSSSGLKHSRKWNSLVNQQTIQTKEGLKPAPTYSRMYKIGVQEESNNDGSWMGWSISMEGPVTDVNIYRAARTFSQAVNQGNVNVKYTDPDTESSSAADVM
jgi:hypothetical protein